MNDFSPRKRHNRIWLMIHLRQHAFLDAAAYGAAAVCAIIAFRQFAAARALSADARGAASGAPAGVRAEPVPSGPGEQGRLAVPPEMADRVAGGGNAGREAARDRFFAELSRRFRLAGFRLNAKNPDSSRAIIEDRDTSRQWLRRKGETLAPAVALAEIGTNAVTLSTPYGGCVLPLSRRGSGGDGGPVRAAAATAASARETVASGAAARLAGHETSPGTWTFARDDIMAYYDEVRRRPERLEAVFDTLAPIWFTDEADGRQKIEGYRVEPCGEEEFFAAVGFREGDVVREVNGIRMDNRYAAEELIRRFAAGDLKFAHIRMERGGDEIIQSYFVE